MKELNMEACTNLDPLIKESLKCILSWKRNSGTISKVYDEEVHMYRVAGKIIKCYMN